jgi:hypothetical protein
MNDENQPIPSAPIIEAVVDIDCDLPPKLDLQNNACQAFVAANRELITCFEQKIQTTLVRVWG